MGDHVVEETDADGDADSIEDGDPAETARDLVIQVRVLPHECHLIGVCVAW